MSLFTRVTIKDLFNKGFTLPTLNNFYNSEPWYLFTINILPGILKRYYGNRELFDDIILDSSGHDRTDTDIIQETKDSVDYLFIMNNWKYKHLYDLYTAEYNPIWNVDGIEKETITRETKNTGTQTNKGSGDDTLVKSGNMTDKKTGDDTIVQTGSIKDENGGGVQNARTTFDSGSTHYDTDKTTDTGSTTTTFNQKTDKTTYNSTNTTTYNSVQDKTTYGKTDTRTDNLTENESISTIKERGGNIGVTMTQDMFSREVNLTDTFKFIDTIARDIAINISY